MSEYITGSEARAVARWEVGSCLRMVHRTKQVSFEPVFDSLHSWSISYGGWDSIPNLGVTVAEGTPTKISCYILEHCAAADWTSAGLAWAHKETEVNVVKQFGVWIESCR